MKKALKVLCTIVVSIIILCAAIFAGARYGWKLFDFRYCESPSVIFARNIMVNSESVFISGDTTNSTDAFVGYTYILKEKKLYVGIKENALMGFTNRISTFNITVPLDTTGLEGIYFKDVSQEELVWSKTGDKKYLGDLTKVYLYKDIPVEDATAEQLEKQIEGAAYQEMNREAARRISLAAYSNEMVAWKGDYLAVALLRNGGKLYLKMSSSGSYFRIIGADEYGVYRY